MLLILIGGKELHTVHTGRNTCSSIFLINFIACSLFLIIFIILPSLGQQELYFPLYVI